MTTQTEALKMALEALETCYARLVTKCEQNLVTFNGVDVDTLTLSQEAITAIKEALAQPEQEKERCVGCEACIDTACGRDECPKGWPKAAQPEQEPVAWESLLGAVARGWCYEENANKTMDSDLAVAIAKEVQALYTIPPQRTWVGLTPQERDEINEQVYGAVPHHVAFHHAIEAKLREKNSL